jgi:tetratricopeptide (TPR) repeat protein
MAVLLESQGNFTDALTYFGRAAASSPTDEAACAQFAKCLMRSGRVHEAISQLETIPHDEQTDAGQLLAHFTSLRELCLQVQDQIDLLSKNISENPTTELYRELADIYALTERSVKAIELLQQAMQLDPANADCINDLGSIYQSNQLYKLGEALARKATTTEFSGDTRIWSLLSLALASQDRQTEARDAYRTSMKLLNLPTKPYHVICSVEALTGTACNLQDWPAVLTLIAIGVDTVTRSFKDQRELYRPNYNALRNRPALAAAKLLTKTDQPKDERVQTAAGEFAYHLYKYSEVIVANTEAPHRGLNTVNQALDAFFTFYPDAQLLLNNLVIERLDCD